MGGGEGKAEGSELIGALVIHWRLDELDRVSGVDGLPAPRECVMLKSRRHMIP